MTGRIYLDFETKSVADLKQVGAWVYSLDPSTEVICMCYRIRHADGNRGGVQEWVPGSPMPDDLDYAIRSGYEVEAHNYAFELAIWTNVCRKRYGFGFILPSQWRDTMAVASYYSMPAALDALCRALKMGGKDPDGKRLISMYCKLHLKTAKREIPPHDLRRFIDYCKQDVLCEEAVSDYLGDLPERELSIFLLDQAINLRGLTIDAEGIDAATAIVDERSEDLRTRFVELTGYNPTQGAKLLVWFAERGLKLDNMQAEYLGDLIEEGKVPAGPMREALTIRLEINKASTKKLDGMSRNRAPDGKARFQMRYHGASTGRWTGAGLQPLNLNRGFEDVEPDRLVRDIMCRSPAWLDAVYGDAMEAVSKASRHWITSSPGHRIMAGDFVSIEAVILACVAGEDWKVEAFRAGKKIYELTADKVYGLPEGTVNKKDHPDKRQTGKVCELAFGYQGALGAWLKFDNSGLHSDEQIVEYNKAWRGEHPMITALWRGLEDASLEAVEKPGVTTGYRDIGFEIVDEWLSMILPDGKRLWYREPKLKTGMPSWHTPEVEYVEVGGQKESNPCFTGQCRCKPRVSLHYMAQKEGQWKSVSTYGGKLTENAIQAISRQFLIPSIVAAEKAKYPVILSVYDEVVSDVPKNHGSLPEFIDILKNAPGRDWAAPWPIGVDAWEGQRYKK